MCEDNNVKTVIKTQLHRDSSHHNGRRSGLVDLALSPHLFFLKTPHHSHPALSLRASRTTSSRTTNTKHWWMSLATQPSPHRQQVSSLSGAAGHPRARNEYYCLFGFSFSGSSGAAVHQKLC